MLPTDATRHPALAAVLTMVALTTVFTLAALLTSTHAWAVPRRVYSGWQVADVPASLWLLLTVSAAVPFVSALVLLRRALALDRRDPSLRRWSLVTLLSVGALVFNALVMAGDSAVDAGPPIPIFHWAFTAVTALLAGGTVGLHPDGRRAAGIAATASGVVTLPLFALGWALYSCRTSDPLLAAGSLTIALGVVPLVVAVALCAATGAVVRALR